jgi:GNAT superfamily N-acetyltransferase
LKITRLASHHNKSAFQCEEPELNEFLWSQAGQYERKDIGRTYVAVSEEDENRVLGFYTVAMSSVPFENVPESLPRHPVPVLHLGRLARDLSCKGQSIGPALLMDVLKIATQMSEMVGLYAVEVVALNDKAQSFYEEHDFKPLLSNAGRIHLYLPLKKIRKLELWLPLSTGETIQRPLAKGNFNSPEDGSTNILRLV